MADKVVNSTELDLKKLEKDAPVKAVTLQKKSTPALNWIIAVMLIALTVVVSMIVYIQFFE